LRTRRPPAQDALPGGLVCYFRDAITPTQGLPQEHDAQVLVEHRDTGEDVEVDDRAALLDVVLHRDPHGDVVVDTDVGKHAHPVVRDGQGTGHQRDGVPVQREVQRAARARERLVVVAESDFERPVEDHALLTRGRQPGLDDRVDLASRAGAEGDQLADLGGDTPAVQDDGLGVGGGIVALHVARLVATAHGVVGDRVLQGLVERDAGAGIAHGGREVRRLIVAGDGDVLTDDGRRGKVELIVSRRHPRLVAGQHGRDNTGWGWTVVRRREPDGSRRSSYYEYLAPDGNVLSFEAESIPVLPTRDAAHGTPLFWGSLVKLYNYQIERPTAIVFDLNFELSRRLYRLALPVRLYERRTEYRGHSKGTILTGMSVRLEDDRAGVLELGFPDSGVIHVEGVGNVPIQAAVFKKAKGRNFVSAQASILFTVNGQVHGTLSNRFCSRQAVRLDYIKNDFMAVLDCSEIPHRVREDLFMPSRDRLRVCDPKQAFEAALEAYLGDHEELLRLNAQRREEELRGRLADDRPLTEALKSVIRSSPELRSLFQAGARIPTPAISGTRPTPFVGVKFPTYFRLVPEPERGAVARIECPLGGHARARFETDAANDYFTRTDDPGTIAVRPEALFDRVRLRDGKATLVFACPEHATVGGVVDVSVAVTDPSRTEPFSHRLQLVVVAPREPKEREQRDRHSRSGALALPKVIEIDQPDWESVGFDAESGLTMHNDTDGGLVAKINIANEHLRRAMERAPESDRDLLRKRFVYGLVLAGVSLWQEFSEKEDCDELIRGSTSAIARVLLPTISVLGSLEHELVAIGG